MDKINKYLNESKEKDYLKSMSPKDGTELKESYYGVADNIEELAIQLNGLNGDTGMFGNDLKFVVKARDAFRKMTLGKII